MRKKKRDILRSVDFVPRLARARSAHEIRLITDCLCPQPPGPAREGGQQLVPDPGEGVSREQAGVHAPLAPTGGGRRTLQRAAALHDARR